MKHFKRWNKKWIEHLLVLMFIFLFFFARYNFFPNQRGVAGFGQAPRAARPRDDGGGGGGQRGIFRGQGHTLGWVSTVYVCSYVLTNFTVLYVVFLIRVRFISLSYVQNMKNWFFQELSWFLGSNEGKLLFVYGWYWLSVWFWNKTLNWSRL